MRSDLCWFRWFYGNDKGGESLYCREKACYYFDITFSLRMFSFPTILSLQIMFDSLLTLLTVLMSLLTVLMSLFKKKGCPNFGLLYFDLLIQGKFSACSDY